MAVDFGDIKSRLQSWIDDHLDHGMILRKDDPLVKTFKNLGEPVYLMADNPTAENIAKEIFTVAQRLRAAGYLLKPISGYEFIGFESTQNRIDHDRNLART